MAIDVSELTEDQRAGLRDLEDRGRFLARLIERKLNGDGLRHRGFALLLFDFDDGGTPATWITNGEREGMIKVVEEWLANARARV